MAIVSTSLCPVTVTGIDGSIYYELFLNLLGHYKRKNPNITPTNFRGDCIAGFDGFLYYPEQKLHFDNVLLKLYEEDLRPATMLELLAVGAKAPNVQRELPLIELDSRWEDPFRGRYVGCLDCKNDEPGVDLLKWEEGGDASYSFLVARRKKTLVV